jgi:hypothetical protein
MTDATLHGRTLSLDSNEVLVEARHYAAVRVLGIVTQTSSGTYYASILRPVHEELHGVSDDGSWYYSERLCKSIVELPADGFRIIESAVKMLAL